MNFRLVVSAILVAALNSPMVSAEMWTGFRGNAGLSVSTEQGLPVEWSESRGVLWSTPIPGAGNSSPAVTNNRVYVTTFDPSDASTHVVAIDRRNGKILWQKPVGFGHFIAYGPPELYRHRHNPATPSPTADAEDNVYAFFGTGDLISLDRDGNLRWRRNLADDYGPYDLKFGMGSSPRYWQGRLYVACIHKGPSYVLALNATTGQEVWLADRNYVCLGDATDAYTSPIILEAPGRSPMVVTSGADHVDAYDLETGKRVWENGGLVLEGEEYGRTIASPAVGDGMVVAPSAKAKLAIAVSADSEGDVTKSPNSRPIPVLTDCPTPTIYDGLIYSVKDDGVGTCVDLKTGKELWKARIGGERYQASPVAGDGKIYFLSLEGKCTVVKAGPKLEKLAENETPGEFYATPAVSNGVVFLRDRGRVIAIGGEATLTVAAAGAVDSAFDYVPDPSFPQWPTGVNKGAVSGVGADSKGRVIVLQRVNPPVLCFEPDGKFVNSFGDDVIGVAHGLTIDDQDNIWVTDTKHHVVFQFSPQGKLLNALGKMDQAGEDVDQFNKPTYIVFGPKSDWYVMDGYGNARIVHYRENGKHPEIWGKPGAGPLEFSAPHAGVLDKQGRLIICDRDNLRIQVLDPQTGKLLETWTGMKPFGVAIDAQGVVFVSDGARNQILQLDAQGKEVRAWGKEGTGPGEFKTPHLIATDRSGNLYAAEVGGQRVQRLKRVPRAAAQKPVGF
ncbi:outer membrane protein assembly factor BamB family protein [Schlesneria paludicola]|uniref:outer membrane protein assembly factor BamB family protein n=1 Tax=Schlesneria paludicola TaxID=360056 RepID=UPI00029A4FAE|nr:PQQ-binding-like beta-propeller repeat protein [Schlesneria paludicola]